MDEMVKSERKNEIVVYQLNESVRIDVQLANDTVWLSILQMCQLFDRERSVIAKHLKNAIEEGELELGINVQNLHKKRPARRRRPFFGIIQTMEKLSLSIAVALAAGVALAGLEPMLDAETIVPNGGTIRFFKGANWRGRGARRITKVFAESPYQDHAAMRNHRCGWNVLEGAKGEYRFDRALGPLLEQCVREHSRVTLGLAWMCGGGLRGDTNAVWSADGAWCAVPPYLYRELQASDHPMINDPNFGGGWTPDYDSPILCARFRALLLAASKWLDGNVPGTAIRRRDVVYGIEMRYYGYWGEGLVRCRAPETEVFDGFLDAYLAAFPDKLLIAPMQEAYTLPWTRRKVKDGTVSPAHAAAMRHVGKLVELRNDFGPAGWFIDCWEGEVHPDSHKQLIRDAAGEIHVLGPYRRDHIWRQRYVTGEFAYFIRPGKEKVVPYATLEHNFRRLGVSGFSVHNFTIIDRTSGQPDPKLGPQKRGWVTPTDESCGFARRALATAGYRFVLSQPKVVRGADGTDVSFRLGNVGVSRMFHDYHRIRIFAEDEAGKVLAQKDLDFDLRKVLPGAEPLVWKDGDGAEVKATLGTTAGKVRLVIVDTKGIEHPLCLSNFGRRAGDGSYPLE